MFARHHTDDHEPAWQPGPVCDEFRGTGIELELIDAVDALERAEAAGRPDCTALIGRVQRLQHELVALAS